MKDLMKASKKRGQTNLGGVLGLITLAVVMVVAMLVVGYGGKILTNINDDATADSSLDNATQSGLDAMEEISGEAVTITQIAVAVVIIGLLVGGFLVFTRLRT